jgi:hypothetical protein
MKAETKASKAAVFAAANRLLEQGITPSVHKIRASLGGGNGAGISKYLKAWRQAMEEAPISDGSPEEKKMIHLPIPPEVARLTAHVQAINETSETLKQRIDELFLLGGSINTKLSRCSDKARSIEKTQRFILAGLALIFALLVGMAFIILR